MTKPNVPKKETLFKGCFLIIQKTKTKKPHTVVESVELSTQMFYLFVFKIAEQVAVKCTKNHTENEKRTY